VTDQASIEQNPIVQRLRSWDEKAIVETAEFRGELTIVLVREHLQRAAEYLLAQPGLQFDFLSDRPFPA